MQAVKKDCYKAVLDYRRGKDSQDNLAYKYKVPQTDVSKYYRNGITTDKYIPFDIGDDYYYLFTKQELRAVAYYYKNKISIPELHKKFPDIVPTKLYFEKWLYILENCKRKTE